MVTTLLALVLVLFVGTIVKDLYISAFQFGRIHDVHLFWILKNKNNLNVWAFILLVMVIFQILKSQRRIQIFRGLKEMSLRKKNFWQSISAQVLARRAGILTLRVVVVTGSSVALVGLFGLQEVVSRLEGPSIKIDSLLNKRDFAKSFLYMAVRFACYHSEFLKQRFETFKTFKMAMFELVRDRDVVAPFPVKRDSKKCFRFDIYAVEDFDLTSDGLVGSHHHDWKDPYETPQRFMDRHVPTGLSLNVESKDYNWNALASSNHMKAIYHVDWAGVPYPWVSAQHHQVKSSQFDFRIRMSPPKYTTMLNNEGEDRPSHPRGVHFKVGDRIGSVTVRGHSVYKNDSYVVAAERVRDLTFTKIRPDAITPTINTLTDESYSLFCPIDVVVAPGTKCKLPSGIKWVATYENDYDYTFIEGDVPSTVDVEIDDGQLFKGHEIKFIITNRGYKTFTMTKGTELAVFLLKPKIDKYWHPTDVEATAESGWIVWLPLECKPNQSTQPKTFSVEYEAVPYEDDEEMTVSSPTEEGAMKGFKVKSLDAPREYGRF